MSSRKRRGAPDAHQSSETPTPIEIEPEGDAMSPVTALMTGGLERSPAIFVLGYMRATKRTEDAPTALEVARELRAHPWVWNALLAGDYVRFIRALGMCGLETVTIGDLQSAASAIDQATPAAPVAPQASAPSDAEPTSPDPVE